MGADQFERGVQVAVNLFVTFQEFGAPGEGGAALRRGQDRKQVGGQLFETVQYAIKFGRAKILGARHRGDIAPQFLEAVIADGNAEILAGNILDFVGFVEYDGVIFGQDAAFGIAVFEDLQRQVGEEQVVVDDNDVALLRHAGASG